MSSDSILLALGFNLHDLVAGFAGGIAVSFALKKSDPWDIVGGIVVGGLAGNYTASMFGTDHGVGAFFAGVVGMPLCQLWVVTVRRKSE